MTDRVNRGFWYSYREEALAFKFSGQITLQLLEFLCISDDYCWRLPDVDNAACARVKHGAFITFESGDYILEDHGKFKVMGGQEFDAKFKMMNPQPPMAKVPGDHRYYGHYRQVQVRGLCIAEVADPYVSLKQQCSRHQAGESELCWQHLKAQEAGKYVSIPKIE